jgi:hypothetical protein
LPRSGALACVARVDISGHPEGTAGQHLPPIDL